MPPHRPTVRATGWRGPNSDITIKVGDGDYQTYTSAHSGDVSSGLIDNPEGTHIIDATTVSGDVQLAAR